MKNKFIDLFAGVGGFHYAAKKEGLVWSFSSEIDESARATYELNHGVKVSGDITKIQSSEIPDFDWLFAGFPCQAFSVGGKRKGFDDTRGTLFFDVARIAKDKQPSFLLLENVKGLLTHDSGNTWKTILMTLDQIGYKTTPEPLLLSPHEVGVPQRRQRIFIPCIRKDLIGDKDFIINIKKKYSNVNLIDKWESNEFSEDLKLSKYHQDVLKAWKDFKDNIFNIGESFSIWSDYWKYTDEQVKKEPDWKISTIKKNIEFYKNNKTKLDEWYKKHNLDSFYPTHRKFEWSVGQNIKFNKSIIQFRPSGIRAHKPDLHPTITTIINQTAIVPKHFRKISIDELKELQSFPKSMKFEGTYGSAVKKIGNAVNVKIVESIIKEMKKYV